MADPIRRKALACVRGIHSLRGGSKSRRVLLARIAAAIEAERSRPTTPGERAVVVGGAWSRWPV